ncbi:Sir2 silent information regulator family NAD-dependent deacetylase [Brachyspira hampsonii]|uniref:Sir2 silent information regulator family NAD-dependent deacetylase n=1 Tax=Brachyspira hampsonii TaxID=1287055 RepID=A0AAC9TTL6_9SPIR|nr:Sir2 silent information regulator family NAD-dependent deacetylase [Brachyspira hampsonii]ASJ20477.1 Sir2 silent information regulator family NAD-dependent deacetylase [Brachyspira hampsonii]MBW5380381.1 Sir2 silent information regulator family NAD-dependent deacetylase [Brachyspira hampsonii]OEJ16620.1 Sir2 silent information regulator family NAD-dependent deacetylase [Brachyspira hampsonii]
MNDKLELIKKLKSSIEKSDYILIGAGAGLSVSAGFSYDGERFDKYFSEYKDRYGLTDMYSAGFYNYPTLEDFWGYFSLLVYVNRYDIPADETHLNLLEIIKNKNYFVITTNVDGRFEEAKFDKEKLFKVQGDYSLFQCSVPCRNETFYNEKQIREMVKSRKDLKIPKELIPKCPHCGKNMTMNLRCDNTFVQDDNWYNSMDRYKKFLDEAKNKNILFLELGVGYNTPAIIKYSFWDMALKNENSIYASVNLNDLYSPDNLKERSICINDDIHKVLEYIKS